MLPADGQISRTFPSDHTIQMHIEDNWIVHRSTRSQSSLTLPGGKHDRQMMVQDLKTGRNGIKWKEQSTLHNRRRVQGKLPSLIKGVTFKYCLLSIAWFLVKTTLFQKVMQSLSRCIKSRHYTPDETRFVQFYAQR